MGEIIDLVQATLEDRRAILGILAIIILLLSCILFLAGIGVIWHGGTDKNSVDRNGATKYAKISFFISFILFLILFFFPNPKIPAQEEGKEKILTSDCPIKSEIEVSKARIYRTLNNAAISRSDQEKLEVFYHQFARYMRDSDLCLNGSSSKANEEIAYVQEMLSKIAYEQ